MKNKEGQKRSRNNQQSQVPIFRCSCGKKYKSKAAVYTHIKNKHNNDKSFKIIDAQKGQISNTRTFRVDQVQVHKEESGLMTLADLTFAKIVLALKEANMKIQNYLHEDDESLSESEDQPQIQKQRENYIEIHMNKFGLINYLRSLRLQENNLQTFKVHKFQLNICEQICKFFTPKFGWKIQAQIILHFMRNEQQNVKQCETALWNGKENNIKQLVREYCKQWIRIRTAQRI